MDKKPRKALRRRRRGIMPSTTILVEKGTERQLTVDEKPVSRRRQIALNFIGCLPIKAKGPFKTSPREILEEERSKS